MAQENQMTGEKLKEIINKLFPEYELQELKYGEKKIYSPIGKVPNKRTRLFSSLRSHGDNHTDKSSTLTFTITEATKITGCVNVMNSYRKLKGFYGRDLTAIYQKIKDLHHPHIVTIFDCKYDKETNITFTIEEQIDGEDLKSCILEHGPYSEDEATDIILQVLDGLSVLHNMNPPIVHNDIKPANIMKRNNGQYVLIDFDISRTVKETRRTQNTRAFGTEYYASPEHYIGFGQTTPASDIYGIGKILFDLLNGTLQGAEEDDDESEIYDTSSYISLPDDLPYQGPLRSVIQKCTSPDPNARYKNADDLAMALKRHPKTFFLIGKLFRRTILPAIMIAAIVFVWKNYDLPSLVKENFIAIQQVDTTNLQENDINDNTQEAVLLVTEEFSVPENTSNEIVDSTMEKAETLDGNSVIANETEIHDTNIETADVNVNENMMSETKMDSETESILFESITEETNVSEIETTDKPYVISNEIVISEIADLSLLSIGRLPGNRLGHISLQQGMFVLTDTYGNKSVFASIEDAMIAYGWAIIYDPNKDTSYIFMPKDYKNIRVLQIKDDLSVIEVAHWPLHDAFPSGCEYYCDYVTESGEIMLNGCIIDTNTWEFVGSYPYDFILKNHHYSIQAQGLVEFTEQGDHVSTMDPDGEFESWNLDRSAYYMNETGIYYMSGSNLYHFDGDKLNTYAKLESVPLYRNIVVSDDNISYYDMENECVKLLKLVK